MCPLSARWVGAPSCGFEARCVQESVIDCDEAFSNAIFDGIEVVGAKLI